MAAQETLRSTPVETLTLKSLAVILGVSQPAPYRHFASRDALLAAVAERGFEQFLKLLHEAEQDGHVDSALKRLCLAYISFGQDNWGLYDLMFSHRVLANAALGPKSAVAADAGFELLAAHVALKVGKTRAARASLITWATLHGVVVLAAGGILHGPLGDRTSVEDLVAEISASLQP